MSEGKEIRMKGLGVSPGVAIGRAIVHVHAQKQ